MKRSLHSLSNYKLLTCNQGDLVPCGLTEVLPGDTIQQSSSVLVRVSPLVSPVMHPVHVRLHHWFVPHRLVWNDWENFITGGPDGMNASVFPTITVNNGTGWAVGSLADYLGVPPLFDDLPVSALPFRGYALIWNEWYRDQDLQTALTIDLTDGDDTTTNTTLQSVCWEKDYFTSSRPWTQKGPAVTLPLGTSATVKTSSSNLLSGAQTPMKVLGSSAGGAVGDVHLGTNSGNVGSDLAAFTNNEGVYPSNLYADLSNATSATINALREAFAIQRYEEARARYGSRYTEYLRYLGVQSSDARLQRPEYLGGGKQTIQFSEVLQTAPAFVPSDDEQDGVTGSLKGHGIGAMRSNRYRRFFEEHGYIFTLMSIKPKTIYAQGLPRTFSRTTKEDFFQKELQFIGQQEVYKKELYGDSATMNDVFGYQDRYDEYRRSESSIAGEFRTSLDDWHFARIFGSVPTLNADFVKSDPATRAYASTATDQMMVMVQHKIQARRLVAKTGTSSVF